ncbi:MAG: NAD(P)-dependent oxidoreductase [Oscillospiraceae bacterium]
MELVILDDFAMKEGDLDWSEIYLLADSVNRYGYLPRDRQLEVVQNADFLIMNKTKVDAELINAAPNLKYVGVIATGTDNIDLDACRAKGISVANVPSYSTYSVAQLTFALMLELCQSPAEFYASVKDGVWRTNIDPAYGVCTQKELLGKTLGLLGYGNIGKAVSRIASAFGMEVLVSTRTPRQNTEIARFVGFDEMLRKSDIISLHCPANAHTNNIINEESLGKMKDGTILINTARGSLIDENAVENALNNGKLGGFGADVLRVEPMEENSPFKATKHTIITPHIAWATNEALLRLTQVVTENLKAFINGKPQNIVN